MVYFRTRPIHSHSDMLVNGDYSHRHCSLKASWSMQREHQKIAGTKCRRKVYLKNVCKMSKCVSSAKETHCTVHLVIEYKCTSRPLPAWHPPSLLVLNSLQYGSLIRPHCVSGSGSATLTCLVPVMDKISSYKASQLIKLLLHFVPYSKIQKKTFHDGHFASSGHHRIRGRIILAHCIKLYIFKRFSKRWK